MSGTVAGGIKAAATNKKLYGKDFYVRTGGMSCKDYWQTPPEKRKPRGFATNRKLASKAGRIGGAIGGRKSKRGPALNN